MNKTILSFICVGLCAVAFAEETAFEGQAMGTIEVRSDQTNLIVSVAFNELSPVDGKPLTAANIVSTKNLSEGDQIHVYTGTGTDSPYSTWVLNSNHEWAAPSMALMANGDGQSNLATPAANEVGSQVGSGFWLIRKNPSQDKPFYIFGAVVDLTSTTANPGLNLMGNPLNKDSVPIIAGAVAGDSIQFPGVDGVMRVYECKANGAGGVKWTWWEGLTYKSAANPPAIAKGVGFWYNSTATSGSVTFTWQ